MIRLIFIKISLISGFLFLPASYASGENIEEYLLRTWSRSEGLPQSRLTTLLESAEGYIWTGSASGPYYFDGLSFGRAGKRSEGRYFNRNITTLFESHKGRLFAGTEEGIFQVQRKEVTYPDLNRHLTNLEIRDITQDFNGTLWIGTSYGLNGWDGKEMKVLTGKDGLYDEIITRLLVDHWGNLWIGTLQGGLARYRDRIERVYGFNEGLENLTVTALKMDRRGTLWIGTLGGLFYLPLKSAMIQKIKETRFLPVTDIEEAPNGEIWFGTRNNGVYHLDENGQPAAAFLQGHFVKDLLCDKQGNIWIATDTRGLTQARKRLATMVDHTNGLPAGPVTAVIEISPGKFMAGTRNNGIAILDGDRVTSVFTKEDGLPGNRIRSLHQDPSARVWIGTENQGLAIYQRGRFNTMDTTDGLLSNTITDICSDNSGTIWIGSDRGINSLTEEMKINTHFEQLDMSVRTLVCHPEDGLYIGTDKGLSRMMGEELIDVVSPGSLNADVLSIMIDQDGMIWTGTNGQGLMIIYDDSLITIDERNGLPDNFIFSLLEDSKERIWMSSYNGVFFLKRDLLSAYLTGKVSQLMFTRFDETEGMASRQCWGFGTPSVWSSHEGSLLYPTLDGICRFEPEHISDNPPPVVVLENVVSGNVPVFSEIRNNDVLKAGSLELQYTAFDYEAPEKLKFRIEIEGPGPAENSEILTDKRRFQTSRLDPGTYRFQISAVNNYTQISENPAEFSVTIGKAFYQTRFFYTGIALVFLLMGALVIRERQRKAAKKKSVKYKTSAIPTELKDKVATGLKNLMENERLYLEPDITLGDLAKKLHVHSNYLSRVINETYGMNFNDFINRYRIEEVKRKLCDTEFRDKSVLEIMYDTGFYSKSVFNTAFRKFTGSTPSEYRKSNCG